MGRILALAGLAGDPWRMVDDLEWSDFDQEKRFPDGHRKRYRPADASCLDGASGAAPGSRRFVLGHGLHSVG
jgi:hypothetical protein